MPSNGRSARGASCWSPACPAFRPPPSACPKVGGHAIYTYVILTAGHEPTDALAEELRIHVGHEMGPIARPEKIEFVTKLPKTRSGKIMRRVLKARALRIAEGDLTMLEE